MPPLTFTVAEATAVAVALAASSDQPFAPDGATALTKLLGAMTPEARSAVSELGSRVWMRTGDPERRSSAARVIEEALRTHVVVRLDFVDRHGNETLGRRVEPLAMARSGGQWSLLAWCRLRQGGRWFRLDRVRAVHLTSEVFEPRELQRVFGAPPPDVSAVLVGYALPAREADRR